MATIKKAQKGKKVSPTYKNLNMGVRNEQYQITGVNKDVKPSSKDSARYRGGFEQGLKGMKGLPNEGQVEKMGRWEGQNAKKKGKMGIKVKKAQQGSSVNPKFKMDLDKFRMKKASDSTSKVMKKAQKGTNLPGVTVTGSTMNRGRKEVRTSPGGAYKMKYTIGPSGDTTKIKEKRTLKGLLTGAPKARGVIKQVFKRGGKMSKKK